MKAGWSCTIASDNFIPEENELYLMLFHVNLQPAHLALLYDHHYYSLSTQKVELSRPWEPLSGMLMRKKIPCLIIHLPQTVQQNSVVEVLMSEFSKHRPLSDNKITCLAPVKATLASIFNIKIQAEIVFDLLIALNNQGKIGTVYSFNIPKGYFVLESYTLSDVLERIKKLQIRK